MAKRKLLPLLLILAACIYATAQHKKPEAKPQEVFGSYWTAEPGWHTEFQLRNNLLAAPLTVTPVLRLANGQEYPLSAVTIPPFDVATVDVSQELNKIAPTLTEQAGTYGSVVFRFVSPAARNLYAALMIHEMGQPIGYHVDAFPMDPEYTLGAREGIWWLPHSGVKDNLIIANGSDQPNEGRLFLYDAAGKAWQQMIQLGARQTVRLVVGDLVKQAGLTGTYGGLRFEVLQRAGSIDTIYFLYDESSGFSAMMKMFDHNPETKLQDRLFAGNRAWTTWAPMLPLQVPDPALALPPGTQLQPKIFLRNTTPQPQVANLKLTFRGDSNKGMTKLAPIQLKPFETHLVDVVALQQSKQIPADAHWALVEISSLGNPDEIMAIASSFDSTGRYGSQTPFADQLSDHWVAGKFEVDSTHNSIIAVTNAGKKPTDAVLTFHYNHGEGQYEIRRTIAAGDQLWLNLGNIIHGSIADSKGRTFPPDLAWGTYEIREPGRNADPSLFEGKIIVDKTNGHLAYGCTTCCADGWPGIVANPELLPAVVWDFLEVIATNSCTGGDDNLTGNFSGWGTMDSSIATMNSTQITGVGPGSTNAFSSGNFNYNNGVSKYCQMKFANPQNTTDVISVQVTTVDLPSDKVTVLLGGPSGTSGQLVVTWNGPGPNPTIANTSASPNTYTFNPGLGGLQPGQYTGVTAQWTVSGKTAAATYNISFDVLGPYRHSQYNTPAESQCSGATSTLYLTPGPSACTWNTYTVFTQFITQAWINGSGNSDKSKLGLFQEYLASCTAPSGGYKNYFRTVSQISPGCNGGSLNATTVAVDVFSTGHPLKCNDQVLIVGLGQGTGTVKTVSDSCPACQGLAQIDDWNTTSACSLIDDGTFTTIRTNR